MTSIIIGLEHSKFAGNCPGSEVDARNMLKILKERSSSITFIVNESATIQAVKDALEEAVDKEDGLIVLYYSGHGSNAKFQDTDEGEEEDGKDEFLCLYDGYLRDNELWNILSKARGRVFEMFDCCHSRTMFRVPLLGSCSENSCPNMLVWSGCPDDKVSYGYSSGGKFTNTFLGNLDPKLSYADIWKRISSDKVLRTYEEVQKTVIGNFDESCQIFK